MNSEYPANTLNNDGKTATHINWVAIFKIDCGFVEMPKQGDAKAAMISLNGSDLDGQKIRVKKDRSKSSASDASPVPPDA